MSSPEKQPTCEERVDQYLKMVEDDIKKAFKLNNEDKEYNDEEAEELIDEGFPIDCGQFDLYGFFSEYALGFNYVEPGTWSEEIDYKENISKKSLGYWRYQIAWGGPQYEIRWYMEDEYGEPDKTLFWFLDWFDGASREPESDTIDLLWEYLREWRNA